MINSSQIKYVTLNEKDKIPIKVFKLNEMCVNPSIVVLGKRGSGKSYLHSDILEMYHDVPATVISPTEQDNPFYCEFENVKNIHYKYEQSIIQNRLAEQKLAIKKYNENKTNCLESDSFLTEGYLWSTDSESVSGSSNNESNQLVSSIVKFAPKQTHENNVMTDRMHELLGAIRGIIESSLTTDSLVNNDIDAMKKLVNRLAEEKQKLIIKNQLKTTYETMGCLLEQEDIGIDRLQNLRDSIDNIINLKTNQPCDQSREPQKSSPNINIVTDNSLEKQTNDTNTLKHMLLLDDCLATKGAWAKDPHLMEVLFNGRHRHLTYVLTMQYPLGITPELRSNFDYVFLFAEDNVSNLKRIYDHYAGFFPDFNTFRQVFRQLTEDYGCMVIINRGTRASFFDKIAFYKAHGRRRNRIDLIDTI